MRKQTVRLHKPQLLNGKSTANTSVVKDMDGLKNLAASLQQNVAFATQNKEAAFYTIGLSGTFFIVAFFFAALCLAADTALMYGVTASSWRDLSGNVPQSDALHIALSSLQGVLAVLGLHFFFKDVEPEIRRKSIFVMGILILIFASCLGITAADMEWLQHQERHGGQSGGGFLLEAPEQDNTPNKSGFIQWLAFMGLKITPFLILPLVTVLFLEVAIENFKKFYIACADWRRISNKLKSLKETSQAFHLAESELEQAKSKLALDLHYLEAQTQDV